MGSANLNFVRGQGFRDATTQSCAYQFPALMWQPRVILVLVLLGLLLETGWYFIGLAGVLWWNALVPRLNPFDVIYNRLVSARNGSPRLTPAPGPRRFSQGMAGTLMLLIGVAILAGRPGLAWALQGIVLLALAALVMGRFCLGSYLFLLFSGQASFAHRTLPWSRPE